MANLLKRLWMVIKELQAPWIAFRPAQIYFRLKQQFRYDLQREELHNTAWGGHLWCSPQKEIGQGIRYQGIFDIVVSEAVARLLQPGATFVDAGANIGYMSVLGASAAGSGGQVISFEPNPEIIPLLAKNVALAGRTPHYAPIRLVAAGLGASAGMGGLYAPANYAMNDGIARLTAHEPDFHSLGEIVITTLDAELGNQHVDVLKMDVEGHEFEVLKGAASLLKANKITHIIFEEHNISKSQIPSYLADNGYNLFKLGYSFSRLTAFPLEAQSAVKFHGSPSYLATVLSQAEILEILCTFGWHSLRKA